ncbi:hypothetical protein BBJ28_00018693 [Nothophytophthora sp. Chile5]|nr:hypothetical protein BBJ28_00018693 [Nothophytophthora sp. Chile5]
MTGMLSSLSASITSALALKPSTVYILRVENTKTRQSWHLRRCFSEFCELREKLLALIDDQMAQQLTAATPVVDQSESSFSTSSSVSSLGSTSSGGRTRELHPSAGHFGFLFKQFPPRKLFGSRSKRVIEARSQALNHFLTQALQVVEAVRQRQQIAVYFSMMTHLELFLECALHSESSSASAFANSAKPPTKPLRRATVSPSAARRASAALALTPGFQHYPLVPTRTPAFIMPLCDQKPSLSDDDEERSSDESHSDDDQQQFNNFDFTRRFYREFGRQDTREAAVDSDSDDEEMHILKKTWSAMLEREVRERPLHHSGSHFAMLESVRSPAASWATRVEIAGIHDAEFDGKPSATRPVQPAKPKSTARLTRHHHSNHRVPARRHPACA